MELEQPTSERETQNKLIEVFKTKLNYTYSGNWHETKRTLNFEENLLRDFLIEKQNYSEEFTAKVIDKFRRISQDITNGLYIANSEVYRLLRYGVTVQEIGEPDKTAWIIDWKNAENNIFTFAEEVTIKQNEEIRPDLVVYVNGIALAMIELKNSQTDLAKGIHQLIRYQHKDSATKFFTTIQLLIAGTDLEGMKYGVIGANYNYFLTWKENTNPKYYTDEKILSLCENISNPLHLHAIQLFEKNRLIEIIKDFILFDKDTKKTCRHHQYFGVKSAQKFIKRREGGIIWHTQGSGKSLTMVILAKWIKENIEKSRILMLTDRDELDKQLEQVFIDAGEKSVERTKSGADLIDKLNKYQPSLICSLVHKFETQKDKDVKKDNSEKEEEESYKNYIAEIKKAISKDFKPKDDIYVFVDECHRTQSGKLHEAMKLILGNSVFIGFTGTPLMSKDKQDLKKQSSISKFGRYIHTYKFDEAVEDGVILDLRYEARDVNQELTNKKAIDKWFAEKTQGLNKIAQGRLKQRWATMQTVLSSANRIDRIVNDICLDIAEKDRFLNGKGNAILVASSIYEACIYYELFKIAGLNEVAVITSYKPNNKDVRDECTGTENETDKMRVYKIYKEMLGDKTPEKFEDDMKKLFKKSPDKLKLLIVVDKLLTGFDAPSATYLYIDKSMRDHGLFQAICRVNRIADESKLFGYIIDYMDLFMNLEKAVQTYTSGAFDGYDKTDIEGLIKNRFEYAKKYLDKIMETLDLLCEPVNPKVFDKYKEYFVTIKATSKKEIKKEEKTKEKLRLKLYSLVSSFIRAFAEIANEMQKAGYTKKEEKSIKEKVKHYEMIKKQIGILSGDLEDLKKFDGDMRNLIDTYIEADEAEFISGLEDMTLVELLVKKGDDFKEDTKKKNKKSQENISEAIENNIRKLLIDKYASNPKFYGKLSVILDELILLRKQQAIEYEKYLEEIVELAKNAHSPETTADYPKTINTEGLRALYDNLDKNEELTLQVHNILLTKCPEGFKGNKQKTKSVKKELNKVLQPERTDEIVKIIINHAEYD